MSTTTTTTTTSFSDPLTLKLANPTAIPRGPVRSTLEFYEAPSDGSKPFNYVESPPEGVPRNNFGSTSVSVEIADIRGREGDFHLDKDAFQAFQGVDSAEKAFEEDASIEKNYYPEVEKLLLDNVPGAHKVVLFDHTVRRSTPNAHRAPVNRVHVDQTPKSTEARVRLHSPEEADELLKGRYRIINVWRPLNGPVQTSPLAFASAYTVDDNDLIGVEHRYPNRTGETAAVQYNKGQQFYYWSGMKNDERLFLKCYDSKDAESVGKRVPHTAFADPRSPDGAVGRESIEVRALVYG